MKTTFTHQLRILTCDGCGAPIEVSIGGGRFPCKFCGVQNQLAMRDEAIGAYGRQAIPEPERIQRLRRQDGKPLLPPPSLQPLIPDGQLPPWKVQEALTVWVATRRELRGSPSNFEAAERLLFLTMVLSNTLSDQQDQYRQRALLESALEASTLPRHRQVLFGYLSRAACRSGDVQAAEEWLAPCDPRSDDLDADSAFRFSRALIDTVRRDYRRVLEVLGRDANEVPLMDAVDPVCAVLRANAWEKVGHVDHAAAVLRDFMGRAGPQGRSTIQKVIELHRELGLCTHSYASAVQAHSATAGHVAAQRASGGIHNLFFFLGLLFLLVDVVFVVLIALALVTDVIPGGAAFTFGILLFTFVPLGAIFTGLGWWLRKKAKRAQWLRVNGLQGTGQVREVAPTGMLINGVPRVRVALMIQVGGHAPYQATTHMLLSAGLAAQMRPGATVPVRVDPNDAQSVLLETD